MTDSSATKQPGLQGENTAGELLEFLYEQLWAEQLLEFLYKQLWAEQRRRPSDKGVIWRLKDRIRELESGIEP